MTVTAPAERPGPVAARRRRVEREHLPVPVLVLAIIALAFFALPFIGLLWKAPWSEAWSILTSESSRLALRLSLWCSTWATITPSVVNGSVKPNQRSRYWPTSPRRPSA